ncbi:thioesterase family protein [Solirubrum puertoriconensis]|uniref:Thioesterase n=1 Tax=Solirubrum puertoriconensis TaxID=1751427 RepID=A0A9X0HMH4_SOLP1|nr:thioesterase family protein [Solirubrum puertoriconensis]KUG08710.1 hypothetical protein ASU33_11250 [Solirubrum puertoriconensis]
MNQYLRLLWVFFTARFRPACPVLGPCYTSMRVGLTDLDVLRHVNNGVYLSMGDVGRMDLLLRSGLWARLKRDMPFAVVAAETIQFGKSLNLFQRFRIETTVLGWDDRLFYLQQRFLRGEQAVATSVVALRFLRRTGGTVDPHEVLKTAGEPQHSPELPAWIADWSASMRELRQATEPQR